MLLRVDMNQRVDIETGNLKDITRIKRCINTIRENSEKVVITATSGK